MMEHGRNADARGITNRLGVTLVMAGTEGIEPLGTPEELKAARGTAREALYSTTLSAREGLDAGRGSAPP